MPRPRRALINFNYVVKDEKMVNLPKNYYQVPETERMKNMPVTYYFNHIKTGDYLVTPNPPPVAPSNLSYTTNIINATVDRNITNNFASYNGGSPSVIFSVSPALPAGLILNTSTGRISGAPTVITSSAVYTVTASNSAGSATSNITITVNARVPSGLTYSPNNQTYNVGVAITSMPLVTPSDLGNPASVVTISPALPAGLSINSSTGLISGTPSVGIAGTTTYTITATSSAGSNNTTISLTYSATVTTIYQHTFNGRSITVAEKPYNDAPSTIAANLSTSSWTTSVTGFTTVTGSGGTGTYALSISNGTVGSSPTITLSFNVTSGDISISTISFWYQRSATGPTNYSLSINGGSAVSSGTVPTTAASVGPISVAGYTNLTGTVTFRFTLSGATSTVGTFRFDDFTITGY
jgi:hypothetical protein